MRTDQQNRALRESTREAIETAAVRVFAQQGFAAASIREIAAEAGLSIGSIYRHFETKDALFEALLDRASSGLAGAAAALSEGTDPLATARGFTVAILDDLAGETAAAEFYLVINQGFLTDNPLGTAQRLATDQQALWAAFADLVTRGQASGQFAPGDPRQITAFYFSMLSGIATMRLVIPDALSESGVDIVLRLLTGERDS